MRHTFIGITFLLIAACLLLHSFKFQQNASADQAIMDDLETIHEDLQVVKIQNRIILERLRDLTHETR